MSVEQRSDIAYGLSQALIKVPNGPIIAQRAPTSLDRANIGTLWIDQQNNNVFILTSIIDNIATWQIISGSSFADDFNTDSGVATPAGSIINIFGGSNINTAGAGNTVTINLNNVVNLPATNSAGTAGIYQIGGLDFAFAFPASNTFVGTAAGNLTLNPGLAIGNSAFGHLSMIALTTGAANTASGVLSLTGLTTGSNNVAIGAQSLQDLTTTGDNTAVGASSLDKLVDGNANTAIGFSAGSNYTGAESSNVIIANQGVLGESNIIRIGTQGSSAGQQDACYIAGIYGVTPSGSTQTVIINASGELGSSASGSGTVDQLTGDSGIAALPLAGSIDIAGGHNIDTVGSANTITVNLTGTTQHALQIGNATSSLTSLGVATNGEIPIGSTGADPVLATITAGTGITVTNGAGTITISSAAAAGAIEQLTGDSGIAALPLAGSVDIAGGLNIDTAGTANTITVNLTGTTNHAVQVGNATSSLTSLAIGTTGQVLIGATSANPVFGALGVNSGLTAHGLLLGQGVSAITALGDATNGQLAIGSTGADPVLSTLTAGAGITVTNGAGTITISSAGAAGAVEQLTADSGIVVIPLAGSIDIAGGLNIDTVGTANTLTINVTGTTNHAVQIGNATNSLTSLGIGTTGQVLIGSTAANPSFGALGVNSGLTAHGVLLGEGTSAIVATAVGTTGQVLIGATGADPVFGALGVNSGLTAHGLLLGQGTAAITDLGVATNGQLPIGSTGADPVLATITAGAGITVTNGAGTITIASAGAAGAIEQLTGGSGIAVLPLAGSVAIAQGNNITTVGTANTLTVNVAGTTNHAVQIGNATNSLTSVAVGTTGQVLIGATGADPAFGALGVNSGLTAHGILLGQGTSAITDLGVATNGQLPIGSTGVDPVLATITAGSGVTVTNGAGTITIASAGTIAASFPTDSGTATPAAGALTIHGGSNITTSGAASTVTVALINSPSVSGSVTAGTTITAGTGITATTGSITATAGNVVITAGNLTLPNTTAALSTGVIQFGGTSWIHNYGTDNTFVGSGSGNGTLTTASATNNVGIGNSVLAALTTGAEATAVGAFSLTSLTSGVNNTGIGFEALESVGTGGHNIGLGYRAGFNLATGSNNIFIGEASGSAYTTNESNNIIIGSVGVISESNVIRIGTTGVGTGQQNTCFIAGSVTAATGITATTGTITATAGNVVITAGDLTLPNTTASLSTGTIQFGGTNWIHNYGGSNVFVGGAGNGSLTVGTAINNQGFGAAALSSITTGNGNIALGNSAAGTLTIGSNNMGIGTASLQHITTGNYNVGIGTFTVNTITTGQYNIGIGQAAGTNLTTSDSSNILLSHGGISGDNNVIRLGTQGTGGGQQSTCFIAGIAGVTVTSTSAVLVNTSTGQLGTVVSSRRYKENISDMDEASSVILNLRPVTFTYKNDLTRQRQYGLIAEEVDDVMPSIVTYNLAQDPETVRYHDLPVLLLNELQKQNNVIAELQHRITILERRRGYESKA